MGGMERSGVKTCNDWPSLRLQGCIYAVWWNKYPIIVRFINLDLWLMKLKRVKTWLAQLRLTF